MNVKKEACCFLTDLQGKSCGDLTPGGQCSLTAIGRMLSHSFIICKLRAVSIPLARVEEDNPHGLDRADLGASVACISEHMYIYLLWGCPLLTGDRSDQTLLGECLC